MKFLALVLMSLMSACGWFSGPLSPLIGAARSGDIGQIQQLAASGADLNAPGGVNNWTPLMHAIHKNQARAVEVLLEAGADADAVSGRTSALSMATQNHQAEIVQILLSHGAKAQQ